MTEEVKKLYCIKLLDVFKRTIKFLEDNNIKWWAAYGTLIGAVRHNGLIPWDDDIDIWVPREDYNRLIQMQEEMSFYDLKPMSIEHNRNYFLGFAKICDTNSTIWEYRTQPSTFGIYIDVFPLDYCDITENQLINLTMKYQQEMNIYNIICSEFKVNDYLYMLKNGKLRTIKNLAVYQFRKNTIRKRLIDTLHSVTYASKGKHVVSLFESISHPDYYNIKDFSETLDFPFEDFSVKIPCGYHDILTRGYGDYMTPPPIADRESTHEKYYLNLKEGLSIEIVRERIEKGERLVI